MESINRLREYVENASRTSISLMARATLLGMVRDIEQEAGNMVPLPVDADGVPWRVGDMTENGNVVNGMTIDFHGWHFTGTRNDIDPVIHRHYVPKPTVEDVLREFVERLDEIGSEDDCVGEAEQECRACIRRDIAAAYAECAAKLRLAEGVDA